jgi:hypothetical protein
MLKDTEVHLAESRPQISACNQRWTFYGILNSLGTTVPPPSGPLRGIDVIVKI